MLSFTLPEKAGLSAAFFNNNLLPCFIMHAHTLSVKAINRKAASLLQLSDADCYSLSFDDLVAPAEQQAFQQLWQQQGTDAEWSAHFNLVNKSGTHQSFNLVFIPFRYGGEWYYLVQGMSAQEAVREASARCNEYKLQQSELFYRSLIADSADGIILSDAQGTISFVAPSVKKILGFEPDELLGSNAFLFVHPDDRHWALESFEREVHDRPEIKSIVVRLKKKDGTWLWCMVRGHNLLANPHVKSMAIYFHDDTLRKQASEALKESEKRFRNLISDLQVGVILSDNNAKTIMCNKAACQLLMVPEHALVGQNIYSTLCDDFVYEDGTYMPMEARPLSVAMRTRQNVKDVVLGFRQQQTGERIWVLVNTDPMLNEHGDIIHIICTIKDITDRKRLEDELLGEQIAHQKELTQATIDGQEKERREIGKELHDNVGQQLTTTKLFLDMAKSTADEQTAEMVSLALKGISDVINEIRSISHALVPPTLGDIGIIESIEELVETIRRVQLLKIDFDYFDFNEDRIPENQQLMLYRIIQEGLSNIVKHAEATYVSIVIKNTNRQLLLEIKDNGKGFNITTARRGLGLTNMKNRADLFGGKITMHSVPGEGCTLRMVVPDKPPTATL